MVFSIPVGPRRPVLMGAVATVVAGSVAVAVTMALSRPSDGQPLDAAPAPLAVPSESATQPAEPTPAGHDDGARSRFLAAQERDDDEAARAALARRAAAVADDGDLDDAEPPVLVGGEGGQEGRQGAAPGVPARGGAPTGGRGAPPRPEADPSRTWQDRGLTFVERLAECGIDWERGPKVIDHAAEVCLGIATSDTPPPTPEEVAAIIQRCEAEFPRAPQPPSSWPEARDTFDFDAAYAQDLANHECIERQLPGYEAPPETADERRRRMQERHESTLEGEQRRAAVADTRNPGIVADAQARILAGKTRVSVTLFGGRTRVSQDMALIGGACIERGLRWQGFLAGGGGEGEDVTVTCLRPDGSLMPDEQRDQDAFGRSWEVCYPLHPDPTLPEVLSGEKPADMTWDEWHALQDEYRVSYARVEAERRVCLDREYDKAYAEWSGG